MVLVCSGARAVESGLSDRAEGVSVFLTPPDASAGCLPLLSWAPHLATERKGRVRMAWPLTWGGAKVRSPLPLSSAWGIGVGALEPRPPGRDSSTQAEPGEVKICLGLWGLQSSQGSLRLVGRSREGEGPLVLTSSSLPQPSSRLLSLIAWWPVCCQLTLAGYLVTGE